MHVRERMLAVVPSAKAEIQASNEGQGIVDDNELLMMCPVKGHISCILKDIVIRVPHHRDVSVPRGAFGAERVQRMLRMGTVAAEGLRDLLVHNDVNLDSGFGPPLEHLIQPPFLVIVGRPA